MYLGLCEWKKGKEKVSREEGKQKGDRKEGGERRKEKGKEKGGRASIPLLHTQKQKPGEKQLLWKQLMQRVSKVAWEMCWERIPVYSAGTYTQTYTQTIFT